MQKANEHKYPVRGGLEQRNSSHMVFEDPPSLASQPEDTTIKENILVYFYWSEGNEAICVRRCRQVTLPMVRYR